ncbi:hypothetical protein HPB48_004143 [Haemaphysalis longicornis]|uniref:Speckle-type POZ protein n=1 Tax=Haemaphysalis longicornis TaxID=44386 RepID=A0A9J6FBI2_HAELO|nr:hypothetical protein HPB48_004143 [Haemaphysalis longicornis]
MPAPDGWCRTERKVIDFTYTWTFTNFNFNEYECGEKVESGLFSSGDYDDFKWSLEMYPNGRNVLSKDYVSLFLRLAESKHNETYAKSSVSIVNVHGKAVNTRSSGRRRDPFHVGQTWGWPEFVSKTALVKPKSKFLRDGSLTILCRISVSEGAPGSVWGRSTACMVNVPTCHLSEDFNRLFESEQFGDVVFKLGDCELRAHKAILVARSPVFASMFEHEMVESIQSRVDVTDIDHEVFREMLRFIYTGEALQIDNFTMELLVAADKYALERLKAMCEKALCSHLSEENAAELFAFADMHSARQLKSHALNWICAHASDVEKTAGWKMISGNPALALEVSMQLFKRAKSPKGPPVKRIKTK